MTKIRFAQIVKKNLICKQKGKGNVSIGQPTSMGNTHQRGGPGAIQCLLDSSWYCVNGNYSANLIKCV